MQVAHKCRYRNLLLLTVET